MTTVNTQKMLVSPSDFSPSPSSYSSQSTRPIGRVFWEELFILSRFHLQLRADEWNFCPLYVRFHILSLPSAE